MNPQVLTSIEIENCKPLEEEEASSPSNRKPSDGWSSSMLSQTPVTVYQDVTEVPGAPKRCMMYLCRTQIPPPSGPLHEEWSLDPGMSGSWGYVFKYELGELWMYQLSDGEILGPSTVVTVLSVEDWAVLKLMLKMAVAVTKSPVEEENNETSSEEESEDVDVTTSDSGCCLEVEEEEKKENKEKKENGKREHSPIRPPLGEKRQRLDIRLDDQELAKMKIILGTIWPSKSTGSGKWLTQASLRSYSSQASPEQEKSFSFFVMERINPDCGLFRNVLVIPAKEWLHRMLEIRERISTLFQNCRNWREAMMARKTLHF